MSGRRRRWLRVLLGTLAALVLVGLLIPVGAGILLTRAPGTRPQDRALRVTPLDSGLAYRSVLLPTRDGLRVSAWLIPSRREGGCSVAIAHGLFRSRREVLDRGIFLAKNGCEVLTLDLRRHGDTRGGHTTLGHQERFDLIAGAEFLRRRLPGTRLFLMGVSMGGAGAAAAAVDLDDPPAGVVLDSTFRNAPEVVDRYARLLFGLPPFPVGELTRLGMRLSARFRARDLDVEAFSRRLGERGVPVLVIAGTADRRAPIGSQEAVFRANGHPASRMVTVAEASHGRPCLVDPAACHGALAAFTGLDAAEPPADERDRQ